MSYNVLTDTVSGQSYRDILGRGPSAYDGLINADSIWYWMHTLCLEDWDPFLKSIPASSFLTVGDGYCGREAIYLSRCGHHVHASDLETCLIEVAHGLKLFNEYSRQDMTQLSFADGAFDYVLVKESLHHLSQPYKGIYEMLRVARKGVFVIEPNGDAAWGQSGLGAYEPNGAYVYPFSSRELIRVGMALNVEDFMWGYSDMPYGRHDMAQIDAGRIAEEKIRILGTALLSFVFVKDGPRPQCRGFKSLHVKRTRRPDGSADCVAERGGA